MSDPAKKQRKTPDFYELLGVDPKAALQDIKNAYRRQARNLHPDVNEKTEDHDLFRQVAEAYRVLSAPVLRKRYDSMRLLGFGLPLEAARRFTNDPARMRNAAKKAAGFFSQVSGIVRKSEKRRGRDLTVETTLSIDESWTGVQRTFAYGREEDCKACEGRGFGEVTECPVCRGLGRIASELIPVIAKRCPRCNARGWIGETECAECSGKGRRLLAHEVRVEAPAGVQHEARLRVRGHGEGGRIGGADGDLIVKVSVTPDPIAKRNGNDLVMPVAVDFNIAALGGVAEVKLPAGQSIAIRVPEGSWNNRRLRVSGRGFRDPQSKKPGDLFVLIAIRIPENLDDQTNDLVMRYIGAVHGDADAPSGEFKEQLVARFEKKPETATTVNDPEPSKLDRGSKPKTEQRESNRKKSETKKQ
jgi:molecular chaperone DnaJ